MAWRATIKLKSPFYIDLSGKNRIVIVTPVLDPLNCGGGRVRVNKKLGWEIPILGDLIVKLLVSTDTAPHPFFHDPF